MGNYFNDLAKENAKNGKTKKINQSLEIDKPVYYLFTSKKDSDIAISKKPTIRVKLFPVSIFLPRKVKTIEIDKKTNETKVVEENKVKERNKKWQVEVLETEIKKVQKDQRNKLYEYDNEIEEVIDPITSSKIDKTILYDNTNPYDYEDPTKNDFAKEPDNNCKIKTHLFIKIYDKRQIPKVIYYLNNNRRLYEIIKESKKRSIDFDRNTFLGFFSFDKNGNPLKKPVILPLVSYKYKKDKKSKRRIVIRGKYETMRELLEAKEDTEKIKRLDNHKESSRTYRESQAEKEDEKRAKGERPVLIKRKRRKYNRPE